MSATEVDDREHVTPWLRRAGHLNRVNLTSRRIGISHHRWTLDYPEDFAFLQALYSALPADTYPRMNTVLAVLNSHPEIAAINRRWHGLPKEGCRLTGRGGAHCHV